MLKKTVTYQNLDGQTVLKDLYFNISANELVEKEAVSNSTYSERLKAMSSSNNISEIYPIVLEFMQDAYGVRTEDGEFEKSPEAWAKFKKSYAFETLMDDLLTDPSNNGNKLADFLNGMLPQDIMARAQEQNAVPGFRPGADTTRPTPPVVGQPTVASGAHMAVTDSSPQVPGAPVISEPEQGIQHQSEPRPDTFGQ